MSGRFKYFVCAVLTVLAGLLSRSSWIHVPGWMDAYLGDIIWGAMVYFLVGCLIPLHKGRLKLISALSFAFAIEFSQLLQHDWINQVRHLPLMGLVLGYGFKWSDLLCYTIGILFARWWDVRFIYPKHSTSIINN